MTSTDPGSIHTTVLAKETIDLLGPVKGGVYVDATLGLGGHALEILERVDDGRVIGIDRDAAAIEAATERLKAFGERFTAVQGNFADIAEILESVGMALVDGIVADLGVSSLQLDSRDRGFSFRFDAPLDMRMNPEADIPTAADLLATLPEADLANVIYRFGEERASRRIARWIVEKRDGDAPITTTKQLADLVERAVRKSPKDKIHPATRTFQALRIAVNQELDAIERFLKDAVSSLRPAGRLAVISFHSLEDRIVKQEFRRMSGVCSCPPRLPVCGCGTVELVELVTRKPVIPTEDEQRSNPRSRSAKLRVVRKLDPSA